MQIKFIKTEMILTSQTPVSKTLSLFLGQGPKHKFSLQPEM